ncbi:hypothetical protein HGA64_03730 [Candidatus Falkowbacteria bacterium]|nr:hypothetical protein [Candidatus Falkowbacteria bacterium]
MYERFQETGEEYEVAEVETINGVKTPVIKTKRKTQEHCAHCDAVIPRRYQEIEVWLNYDCEGCGSDIHAFCSFQCLSDWAANQKSP